EGVHLRTKLCHDQTYCGDANISLCKTSILYLIHLTYPMPQPINLPTRNVAIEWPSGRSSKTPNEEVLGRPPRRPTKRWPSPTQQPQFCSRGIFYPRKFGTGRQQTAI
ncbi:unnamed protein product, partial [Discosporangium mesarthrocarpum]